MRIEVSTRVALVGSVYSRRGPAAAELGAPRVAAVDVDAEAALGRLRAHRLDEIELLHVRRWVDQRQRPDGEDGDKVLRHGCSALMADAATCGQVSDDRRPHIGGRISSCCTAAARRAVCARRVHPLLLRT